MSWLYRRGGTPEELHARYGLRRLTWRGGLLWRRLGRSLATTVAWSATVLWLLSQLYEPGLYTVVTVVTLGFWLAGCDLSQDRSDIPHWPRRTD